MKVSWNGGSRKSSIWIGFAVINQAFGCINWDPPLMEAAKYHVSTFFLQIRSIFPLFRWPWASCAKPRNVRGLGDTAEVLRYFHCWMILWMDLGSLTPHSGTNNLSTGFLPSTASFKPGTCWKKWRLTLHQTLQKSPRKIQHWCSAEDFPLSRLMNYWRVPNKQGCKQETG